MNMVEMECAGERLRLLHEKAIFWPATETSIIADLHLGKSATFRSLGIAVPETTTSADLERLERIVVGTGSKRLIILGDLFHDRAGLQPATLSRMESWCVQRADLEIILVPGNHDRKAGRPPRNWNIREVENEWRCGPFLFSHEPVDSKDAYVLAGHVHPSFILRDRFGPNLRAPCFYFGERCGLLPAFGSFTGTSEILPEKVGRIFVIGPEEIIELKNRFKNHSG
jgi:uncharacterized protein